MKLQNNLIFLLIVVSVGLGSSCAPQYPDGYVPVTVSVGAKPAAILTPGLEMLSLDPFPVPAAATFNCPAYIEVGFTGPDMIKAVYVNVPNVTATVAGANMTGLGAGTPALSFSATYNVKKGSNRKLLMRGKVGINAVGSGCIPLQPDLGSFTAQQQYYPIYYESAPINITAATTVPDFTFLMPPAVQATAALSSFDFRTGGAPIIPNVFSNYAMIEFGSGWSSAACTGYSWIKAVITSVDGGSALSMAVFPNTAVLAAPAAWLGPLFPNTEYVADFYCNDGGPTVITRHFHTNGPGSTFNSTPLQ